MFKKIIPAALLCSVLIAPSAQAGALCEDLKGVDHGLCLGALGVSIITGGATLIGESIFSALVPATKVAVKLPSGELISGEAPRRLMAYRRLVEGKPLELNCRVNSTPLAGEYGYASCDLSFPALPPKPNASDFYERTGQQPSWGFGANQAGWVEPSLLRLERPLVWHQGQGL